MKLMNLKANQLLERTPPCCALRRRSRARQTYSGIRHEDPSPRGWDHRRSPDGAGRRFHHG